MHEEFVKKLSFELDCIVNEFLKPDRSDEGKIQQIIRNNFRSLVYTNMINPILKKAREDGPTEEILGLTNKIRKSCNNILADHKEYEDNLAYVCPMCGYCYEDRAGAMECCGGEGK